MWRHARVSGHHGGAIPLQLHFPFTCPARKSFCKQRPPVVGTLKTQWTSVQNLVQMSRLMILLTHQEDIQRFITHKKRLYGESRTGFQSWFENVLREQERRLTWIFIAVRGWGWSERCNAQPHTFLETSESKICNVGWQLRNEGEPVVQFLSKGWQSGDPEELMVHYEVWRSPAGEFPLAWGRLFFLFYSGFNWVDEAHVHHGGQSIYTEFTELSVNIIQNTLQVDT